MSEYEKLVPVECRHIVANAMETARDNLAHYSRLQTLAIVGSLTDLQLAVLALELLPSKTDAAEALGKFARMHDADFVLFISEMWMLNMKVASKEEALEIEREARRVGVANMPGRIDGVTFQLETGVGHFLGSAEIIKRDGVRTFENPPMEFVPDYRGRFAHVLPKSK